MNNFLSVVRDILRECLSATALKGARLKPLVANEFERRTGVSFRQAFWNSPKFSDLLKLNEDLVELDTSAPGDIMVRLRAPASGIGAGVIANYLTLGFGTPVNASYLTAQPYVHPGLWHAFTNPDPRRRRFFHRHTREVVHYLEGDNSGALFVARVSADPNFVEIKPVSAVDQSEWMKEFVHRQSLPESTRKSLLSIAELPYTSHLNRAFTGALEGHSEGWRHFRTAKMLERIHRWAEDNNVALPELIRTPTERPIKRTVETLPPPSPTLGAAPMRADTRRMLHALVDMLDEAELSHVLVPASALLKIPSAYDQ